MQATSSLTLRAIYSRRLTSAQETAQALSEVDLYASDAGAGKDYADLLARDDIKAVIIAYVCLVCLHDLFQFFFPSKNLPIKVTVE